MSYHNLGIHTEQKFIYYYPILSFFVFFFEIKKEAKISFLKYLFNLAHTERVMHIGVWKRLSITHGNDLCSLFLPFIAVRVPKESYVQSYSALLQH